MNALKKPTGGGYGVFMTETHPGKHDGDARGEPSHEVGVIGVRGSDIHSTIHPFNGFVVRSKNGEV